MFSEKTSMWEPFALPEDTPVLRRIGPMTLWLLRKSGELWIQSELSDAETSSESPNADGIWKRWALRNGDHSARLRPFLPDKSVVVKPEYEIHLLKGSHVRTYTRVPIWIGIEVIGETRVTITELPTQVLSNTWFGGFTDGELCYWVATSARRSMPVDLIQPHHAVCIMDIRNHSDADLNIDKICLRVERLSLFEHNGHLWADDTEIAYEGDEGTAQIRNDGEAPVEVSTAVKVNEPRQPHKRGLAERAFFLFRDSGE